jgi:signal transduction histidine kinase
VEAQAQVQLAQVVTIDPDTYVQNNWSNNVYRAQRAMPSQAAPSQAVPQQAALPQAVPSQAVPPQAVPPQAVPPQAAPQPQAVSPQASPAPRQITITVSPLEWRTLGFAGQPAVIAVRQVDTPDGRLAQGFVVDRTALTSWLASHAGDAVAELRTGDSSATEIVPGWHLEVAANPLALVAAASEATTIARGFVLRFSLVGVVAILAACLVVMLVAHAERLARERSQFAAAAAHELRTPLAGLQLYGDMLADGLGDPSKMRDYARRMSEEASRLGRVVSNVLGFSQLERGNLSVEPRAGALGDALCELAERAQPALDRAGAVLALDVAPELSATFDRDALARIVGNLLDNAEKYGRQAEDRTITLAARATAATVEVVVSDHGPGIAPQARARLFQPFARGVTADGPAGLGLGLALSQSLARAMGGELAYRSVPDGGAAFVLTLARG